MLFEGKLIDLIAKADFLEWSLWVYSEPYDLLTPDIQCIAIDVDNAVLGTDGFTPLEVEERGFQELISMQGDCKSNCVNAHGSLIYHRGNHYGSMQDLQVVLKKSDSQRAIKAIDYYVKNDAYLSE